MRWSVIVAISDHLHIELLPDVNCNLWKSITRLSPLHHMSPGTHVSGRLAMAAVHLFDILPPIKPTNQMASRLFVISQLVLKQPC